MRRKKEVKPKRNKKEIKKLRAAIVTEKSQATKPIKTEIAELEASIPTAGADKAKQESKLLDLQIQLEELNEAFQKRLDEI